MKRKALFVGVNDYEDSQIRNLSYSLSDAYALNTLFEGLGYQTDILENPTKAEVFSAVRQMTADLSAGDFFLFFFAGHGWTTGMGKHLLFCKDDMYEDLRYDYNVGIPFDILKKRTEAGGYSRAFVLDACRSDFMTGTRGSDTTTRDLRPIGELVSDAPAKSGLAVLRSCSKYEHALEIESRRHGLFTLALMDVLRQSSDSGMELLFGETLCDAVTSRMSMIAREEGITAEQTPEFAKAGAAQVLVSGRKAAVPPQTSAPSASVGPVVCPICGKYNLITDTFKCRVCGKDHLCLAHRNVITNCCDDCAKAGRKAQDVKIGNREDSRSQQEESVQTQSEIQAQVAQQMFNRGEDFYYGKNGVVKSYEQATRWYRMAAEKGDAWAQCKLAICYVLGRGVEKDYEEAVKWYFKSATQGNAIAQRDLGRCYDEGKGVNQNYLEAAKWYLKAAEQGDAVAQFNLGCLYDKGQGVSQNSAEAVKWYRKAAEQGYAPAQFNLASCLWTGQGIEKDYSEGIKWLVMAAEQGHDKAQVSLGVRYIKGQGVSQDYKEAVKWFFKAAEQGNSTAQHNIGTCYMFGRGVVQDAVEAVKWYRKAAEQGYAKAQYSLGKCYENGDGVEADYSEASKWYGKAAAQGHEEAKQALKTLQAR